MGATIVAAWIDAQKLSLAHVGDSRAYLLRAGSLEQLTADHSLVAEKVRVGILDAAGSRRERNAKRVDARGGNERRRAGRYR